jgi:hypothetical protein
MFKKKLKKLILISLFIISIFAIWSLSTILHEFVHKFEYREIIKTSESMCFLGINYNFTNQEVYSEKCFGGILDAHYKLMPSNFDEMRKAQIIYATSEIYAYVIQFLFMLMTAIPATLLFIKRWDKL